MYLHSNDPTNKALKIYQRHVFYAIHGRTKCPWGTTHKVKERNTYWTIFEINYDGVCWQVITLAGNVHLLAGIGVWSHLTVCVWHWAVCSWPNSFPDKKYPATSLSQKQSKRNGSATTYLVNSVAINFLKFNFLLLSLDRHLLPILGDSQQVLYRTTNPVFDICNAVLPLATMASATLQSALKDSLWQGVVAGHMAKRRPSYIVWLL